MFPWTTQAGRSWLIPGNVSINPDPTFVNYDSSKRSKIALVSDGGLFLLCSWNDSEQFLLSTVCRDSLLAVGDDKKWLFNYASFQGKSQHIYSLRKLVTVPI